MYHNLTDGTLEAGHGECYLLLWPVFYFPSYWYMTQVNVKCAMRYLRGQFSLVILCPDGLGGADLAGAVALDDAQLKSKDRLPSGWWH